MRTDPQELARRAQKASARAERSFGLAMTITALAIAGVFALAWHLGWIFGQPAKADLEAGAPAVTATPTAYKTELTGVDEKNLPYKIEASQISQAAGESKKMNLQSVNGNFARNETESLDISSVHGQYQTDTKMLDLEGEVVIKSSSRMTATMDKATVDVTTRRLQSRSPVKVLMGSDEITADQLVVDNNGEKIKFKGRVKASFGGEQK